MHSKVDRRAHDEQGMTYGHVQPVMDLIYRKTAFLWPGGRVEDWIGSRA